jgi:tRNA (mo5U34)-methyltransferase
MMTPEQLEKFQKIKWFHRIDLGEGIITPGRMGHTVEMATTYFGMPKDLTGKTVLDIGCGDGIFSFEAERRGGIVTASDTPNKIKWNESSDGFHFAKEILNSKIPYWECDVYDIPDGIIPHDIVFFYGVLYHLLNPIFALQKIAKATKEFALIETAYAPSNGKPQWEFRPGYHNDATNWWYPTPEGLYAALKYVGFKSWEVVGLWESIERFTVKAYK